MKNKQVIIVSEKSRRDYRSVEPANAHQSGIPNGMPPATEEANLRLAGQPAVHFSTERCKPAACASEKNNLLQVIYFCYLADYTKSIIGSLVDSERSEESVVFAVIDRHKAIRKLENIFLCLNKKLCACMVKKTYSE